MVEGLGAGGADAGEQNTGRGVRVRLDADGQQVDEAAYEVLRPGPVPPGGQGAQGERVAFGVGGQDRVHAGQAEHVRADAVPAGGLGVTRVLRGADPQPHPVAGSAEDGGAGAVGDQVECGGAAVECALPEPGRRREPFGAGHEGVAQVLGVAQVQGRQVRGRVRVQGGQLGGEEVQGPVVGDGMVDGEVEQCAPGVQGEHQGAQQPGAVGVRLRRAVLGGQGARQGLAFAGRHAGEVDVAQRSARVGGQALPPAVGVVPYDGPQGGLAPAQQAQCVPQPGQVEGAVDEVAASDDVPAGAAGGLLLEPDPLLGGRQRQPAGVRPGGGRA